MTVLRSIFTVVVACLSFLVAAVPVAAQPLFYNGELNGIIVPAAQRFDPAMQRFMAEQSLRALPLRDGQLFYVYPIDTASAYSEQLQIRYLETLLKDASSEKTSDGDEPQSD